jgi:hypothetical protein
MEAIRRAIVSCGLINERPAAREPAPKDEGVHAFEASHEQV